MNRIARHCVGGIVAALLAGVFVGQTHAERVDLRGYGTVRAFITPERSEFVCENPDKADILLGKLLADLFWDAGKSHVTATITVAGQNVLIHEWPPYGALIAARNGNRVLVLGGADTPDVATRAKKERALTSGKAVFAPANPYPRYLDYYDLRAVSCGTLGLHPENKFRYQERTAFTQQFVPGGNFNGSLAFFGRTPAEGVLPSFSLLDTDLHLAEKNDQLYSISISTGEWPVWAQDRWPEYVDRQSPLHLLKLAYGCPPESFGLSSAQRRQTSLKLLYDVMSRYTNSPAMGGWELYCGDYICETYFSKGYQGHLGLSDIGQEAFRRWLRDERRYSLAQLGKRWHGDAGHFKNWSDVTPPDPDEFFGDFRSGSFPIADGWSWKKAEAGQLERPADEAPGWVPVRMPPSQQMLALPAGPAFWRNTFDATAWLQKNAGKDVYLVGNVDNGGWRTTNVWLNGTNLGEHKSKVSPIFGPFALKVTGLLRPGANQVHYQVTGGSGCILGPVFLTTTLPQAYPYLGKLRNAQYVDMMEWRLSELNFKVTDAMAYARSIDPNRPFVLCATSQEVKAAQGDALRQFGGSMQDTGYEASYRPHNSRFGYAGGFYGSAERSGIHDIKDPAGFAVSQTKTLSWLLSNGEGMYKEWRDPYCYYEMEKQTGWFTKNQRRYQLIGKALPEKPGIALLSSSQSALLGYEGHVWDWDLGRGELQASHYDHVYVTEQMLAQGLADAYPVLFDTDTMIMSPETIAALRRYVESGGTFIATHNSGRHALLEPDAWPISELTGFKTLTVGKKGKIRFARNLPLFKGWEGKEFQGEGSALDWKETQSAKDVGVGLAPSATGTSTLANWEDGTVAVGMRKLGKGKVIVLGSTFWRFGRDVGGTGMWRTDQVEPAFLNRLFTDLGVLRTADASSPELYARKMITKNGLQEWLVAMNTIGTEVKADVGFTVNAPPVEVWDMMANTPVPFTCADGWVRLKDVAVPAYTTRVFGVRRSALAGGVAFWWFEKTKFWTRHASVTPRVEPAAANSANPSVITFDAWRFCADTDGTVGKANAWLTPTFNDQSWRRANNEPWNFQFTDLQEYGGVGLYRSAPFALPAGWKASRFTLNIDGAPYCWSAFELYLNGEKVEQLLRPDRKVDVTTRMKKEGNVVCVKLTGKTPGGDYPLSGLVGCAIWIQPEITLTPTLSLLGEWQAVQGDWVTTAAVSIPGIESRLTADGRLKAGVTPVTANHLVRNVEIPAAWSGKKIYLHLVTPQMHSVRPPGVTPTGLTQGMVMVNGLARPLDQRPNLPLDEMVNLTPFLRCGATNRIELWSRDASHGSMKEDNIVINNMEIGCAAE